MAKPDLKKIIKECFWDYQLNEREILAIANGDDERKKSFIFANILENSLDVLKAIEIFSAIDQIKLIQNYKIPLHNKQFLTRRYQILRFLILGETVKIPELEWRI